MPRSKTVVVAPKTPATIAVQSPSLMQTFKEGAAFGAGSSLARMMLDRVFSTNAKETSYDSCSEEKIVFERCLVNHTEHVFCGDQQFALNACLNRK